MVYDPLDNIMTNLRGAKAIDPATAAQRGAGLKTLRRQHGVAPIQPGRLTGAAPVPDRASPEEGTETGMTAPETTIPIIIDALNESIIALKVEIHRTANPETRRMLETQANKLRQQVQELGGEPVWADESVEEGLQKLTGQGFVALPALQQVVPAAFKTLMSPQQPPKPGGWSAADANLIRAARSGGGWTAADADLVRAAQPTRTPARQVTPTVPSAGRTPQAALPGVPRIEAPTGQPDHLTALLQQIAGMGAGAGAVAPTPQVDTSFVNDMLESYGLRPRSAEEIAEHARVTVERMRLSKEQIVQRELDRFEREHPPEFARQQEQIRTAADTISAANQEEFASRGMFYSSVMAQNMGELDAKVLDMVGEISSKAASQVMDLQHQLRDIAEWAVLEEEVLRRELETQNQTFAAQLADMRLRVAQWGDEMALNSWAQGEQFRIDNQRNALQAIGMQIQQIQHQQELALQASIARGQQATARMQMAMDQQNQQIALFASAAVANHPDMQRILGEMGFNPEMIANMPLHQQAGLVDAARQLEHDRLTREERTLTNTATAISAAREGLMYRQETRAEQDWLAALQPAAQAGVGRVPTGQLRQDWQEAGWLRRLFMPHPGIEERRRALLDWLW